jgi:hypothetical protein
MSAPSPSPSASFAEEGDVKMALKAYSAMRKASQLQSQATDLN